MRSVRRLPLALWVASILTVVVTVSTDLVAGSHPAHALAVGAVAAAIGAARLRHVGRYKVLFGLLSAAVVAQPVLHAVDRLVPSTSGLRADNTASVGYLLLVAAVVTTVGVAEQLGEIAGTAVRALLLLLHLLLVALPDSPAPLRLGTVVRATSPRRRAALRYTVRRGPPAARAARPA